jgi:hypothetical protein
MTPLSEDEEVLKKPLIERLIKPSYQKFLRFIGNIAPKQIRQKYENVISLQNDLDKLIEKHKKMIDNNDFGGALNIMKNIDILTDQLKKIDYETIVSKFATADESGKRIQLISFWK